MSIYIDTAVISLRMQYPGESNQGLYELHFNIALVSGAKHTLIFKKNTGQRVILMCLRFFFKNRFNASKIENFRGFKPSGGWVQTKWRFTAGKNKNVGTAWVQNYLFGKNPKKKGLSQFQLTT